MYNVGILASCLAMCFAANPSKRLIEFGWDEPDTAFMREHIAEMEKTPFDGCVFHLNYRDEDGSTGSFTWECWGKKKFTEEQLKGAVDDLRNTLFQRFTHNFLRFNVTPGDVDWFDDFSAVLSNAKLAAKVAKQGGVKGILFDIEQYNSALFNYSQQRDSSTKSFSEYARQVRKRGNQLMEAFQSEYPNITIFLTFGYCLPWVQMGGEKKLEEVHYGLLAPLLDGMVDGANGESVIVDGGELAYSYKDTSRFATTYKMMTEDVLKIVANPQKYKSVFSLGFGVWMDNGWRREGWNTKNFENNFYTPEAFEATLSTALKTSDEYVWIYTETPRWWTASGKPEKLPQEYVKAVWRALKKE
ncbi:MAG: hypothetical protein ACE5PV_03375 [Candidatus Poribacteria bacterium]